MGLETYQRLSLRIDFGTVQRVAGDDLYILGKVFFERGKLWGLARGLTTDDSTDLGSFYYSTG